MGGGGGVKHKGGGREMNGIEFKIKDVVSCLFPHEVIVTNRRQGVICGALIDGITGTRVRYICFATGAGTRELPPQVCWSHRFYFAYADNTRV